MTHPPARGDVVVVGGGVIGLACAAELAQRGVATTVVRAHDAGEASIAAAGLLAPGLERRDEATHRAAVRSRELFPELVAHLADTTGLSVPLDRSGILELIQDEAEADRRRGAALEGTSWLDTAGLSRLEPALAPAAGAVLHEHDGAVDNERLVHALEAYLGTRREVVVLSARVAALELDGRVPAVRTAGGDRIEAARIVLAAGAWAPLIRGLPRKLDVRPLRGQMIALPGTPVRHSVYGGHYYLVPRADGVTLAGATLEEVGFESAITTSAGTDLAAAAAALSPHFAGVAPVRQWSGLRPVTPDLLPILGPDPAVPALLYACGHSRNGILLAPYTARAIAGYVVGEALERDVAVFSISRFVSGG